jgi:hypothetical protein
MILLVRIRSRKLAGAKRTCPPMACGGDLSAFGGSRLHDCRVLFNLPALTGRFISSPYLDRLRHLVAVSIVTVFDWELLAPALSVTVSVTV